jgi:chromosome segregation ATPase
MSDNVLMAAVSGGGGGDDNSGYNLYEARRQISALWKKLTEMSAETTANGKDLAQIRTQNDYIVKLLEKIDASNQLALPRCAERGVVLEDVKRSTHLHSEEIGEIKTKVEQLEGTSRLLKWLSALLGTMVAAILTKRYLDIM